jgi:hypothetical protein|tara:strand:+ start:302 stop:496 length:195 start_codon:yes stop_codon:yes gene_type:complete
MKWLLISMLLANPITYPDEQTCRTAQNEVLIQDETALCIPAGESQEDRMILNFFNLVDKMKETK